MSGLRLRLARVWGLALGVALLPGSLAGQQAAEAVRVIESASATTVDLETLAARVAAADVVFLGEQHDDPATHRLQLALFEAVAERRGQVTLALEMFDRDVQAPLDLFWTGQIDDVEFQRRARPWQGYVVHYKPLVEFAIARRWPVVAANVPRPIAADVASRGLEALAGRSEDERDWFAAELQCAPAGAYFDRFVAALGTHGQTLPEDARERYYEAQCLKDETMAESIERAVAAGSNDAGRPLVVSINGTVHVDFRLGTVERLVRRLPDLDVVTLKFHPVASLADGVEPGMLARADFVVLTQKPAAATSPSDGRPDADSSSSEPSPGP